MFKNIVINGTGAGNYAEEGQPNPLRWLILAHKGDGVFDTQGAWWKCKDFLNDYVYSYNTGENFTIYGFNAGSMKIPTKGEPVYLLLKALNPSFLSNFKVMNAWLKSQKIPEVDIQTFKDGQEVIKLDAFYFKNTLNISLITLIIRLMNDEHVFQSFQEVIDYKKFPQGDQWKWETAVKKGMYFKIPKELEKYIWFYNKDQNSEKCTNNYQVSSLVHNCGVVAWSKGF